MIKGVDSENDKNFKGLIIGNKESQQASNITNIINNNNINNFIISDAPGQKTNGSNQPIKIALNRSSATPETLSKNPAPAFT